MGLTYPLLVKHGWNIQKPMESYNRVKTDLQPQRGTRVKTEPAGLFVTTVRFSIRTCVCFGPRGAGRLLAGRG